MKLVAVICVLLGVTTGGIAGEAAKKKVEPPELPRDIGKAFERAVLRLDLPIGWARVDLPVFTPVILPKGN
jgi:hypothetical protein